MKRKFLVTCDPGLEDIVKEEVKEKVKNSSIYEFQKLKGRLIVETKNSEVDNLLKLHSIYHIIEILYEFNFEKIDLENIERSLKNVEIEKLKDVSSFRVTSNRIGTHNFTSIDIQKIVGKVLKEKYNKKVDLKNYELEIIADVINNTFLLGIKLTKESLHKRFKKVFEHRASIKPTIAYGMLKLANLQENDCLLDPMCGSGTIVLEAASLFRNKIKIFASDIDENIVNKAKENAKINNLDEFIVFRVADAKRLEEYYSSVDKIVTNPPYGIRLKEIKNIRELYEKFLVSASKILNNNGKIVLITLKFYLLERIIKKTKCLNIIHKRVVESGGIFPRIYVLEKI